MDTGSKKGSEANKQRYQDSPPPISGDSFPEEPKVKDYSKNTDRLLAKQAGIGHDTLNKVEKIIELAPPEIIEKLETKHSGSTINSVFKELRSGKKREAAEIVGFPTENEYDVIYFNLQKYKVIC